ncbi:hypothetical protein [Haloferula sp. A504]|uniref:hypothetical protein n=1 Tax=Haloferula sp. A504 TaxID=3373601 RepID=UPI0031CAAF54|nr:hypothetical protein [Verrucomicrobiaceae bacterium E54]
MKFSPTSLRQGLVVAGLFCGNAASAATIISQTANGASASSGSGNYGQSFEVDSTLPDNLLSSFSLTKGGSGGGTTTGYIDVYTIGTAVFDDLNFGTGVETGNLNFLGSSTNSIDTASAASGDSLTWNFASIALPTDEAIFLVFSDTSGAGSFVGTSVRVEGSVANQVFTNTNASESHTLAFAGDVQTAFGSEVDNTYSVTLVPEPSAAGFSAAALVGLLLRRRRS